MANVLDISHLHVEFAGRTVLDDVSTSLPMGGMTVFVGPNGAGKTTLLLCIMGEVKYRGRLTLAQGVAGHIGYVPQSLRAETCTPITCAEFLYLGASRMPLWCGASQATRKAVAGALARVDMSGMELRPIADLSGGQMRRLLLAGALLRSPRLLLLDEPAAGVDLKGERLFWEILDGLRRETGLSVVMVNHNLYLTAHYATHVVCVHNGGIMAGTPHEVLTASNLMTIFGVPIHLYPDHCALPHELCPSCGAFRDTRQRNCSRNCVSQTVQEEGADD